MNRLTRLRALAGLGAGNVARVGLYRLGLRSGLHPVLRTSHAPVHGPYFRMPPRRDHLPEPNRRWHDLLWWYDWKAVPHTGAPPNWFSNPFSDRPAFENTIEPWWRIPDFGTEDVKNLWELSRLGWVLAMATEAAAGDDEALARLNRWVASWTAANPFYRGPNWKCGQEASIRVMHLVTAAVVLNEERDALPGLVALVEAHLQRIAPTVSYAVGQQNNHGTSEAAALFIGGDFVAHHGVRKGAKWRRMGRRLLENRATALIEPDGSFSQYSVVYHRVMLDAYCLAEAWRRRANLEAFTPASLARLQAATRWLDAMVERSTGSAPNLGANDGTRLLPLTDTAYRDFRPTLQLASALFLGTRAIVEHGAWDSPAKWLDVDLPATTAPDPVSRTFDNGGYHALRVGKAFAMLRYPRFSFRPGQADALHLDVSFGPNNLLRDGGSFSYNDTEGFGSHLAGTAAHNTVQFDGRDQMPRLGRFLFGDWLKASSVAPVSQVGDAWHAAAGYRDAVGAEHNREVTLERDGFRCVDTIGGKFSEGTLRWRLAGGSYSLNGNRLVGEHLELTVDSEQPITIALVPAWESTHYQQRSEIPCLEVRFDAPGRITTRGRFLAAR